MADDLLDIAARERVAPRAVTPDNGTPDDITETLAITLRTLADIQARHDALSRALPWVGAACLIAGALGTTLGGLMLRMLAP